MGFANDAFGILGKYSEKMSMASTKIANKSMPVLAKAGLKESAEDISIALGHTAVSAGTGLATGVAFGGVSIGVGALRGDGRRNEDRFMSGFKGGFVLGGIGSYGMLKYAARPSTTRQGMENAVSSLKAFTPKDLLTNKEEIASSIARRGKVGKMITLPKSEAPTINRAISDAFNVYLGGAEKSLANAVKGGTLTQDAMNEALEKARGISAKTTFDNLDESLTSIAGINNEFSELFSKETIEEFKKDIARSQDALSSAATNGWEGVTKHIGTANTLLNAPMAYFNPENAQVAFNRRVGVGAGVAGAALVGRYASGGTLTRNNRGEGDIAGVPFI